jgi:septal ring factor EnvC (AmiA/AmiB activator)
LRRGDIDVAISRLRPLIEKPEHKCRAAFYLFALDSSRKEYREVLLTDFCRDNSPAHARLVEQLVDSQEQLGQCGASLKKQQSRVEALKKESVFLEKEISRLRFEMEKLEEIRRETEQWRLK